MKTTTTILSLWRYTKHYAYHDQVWLPLLSSSFELRRHFGGRGRGVGRYMASVATLSLRWEKNDNDNDDDSWNISLREEERRLQDGNEATINNAASTSNNHDGDYAATPLEQGDIVEDATWQLERQKRKAQHAHKVSRAVVTPQQLDVQYQDEHVIVVNKPGGVLTIPGVRQHANSLLDVVHEYAVVDDGLPTTQQEHRIVHRLDMDTSGLVLLGRSLAATKQCQAMFRERAVVTKRYRAVVAGHWPVNRGSIHLALQRDMFHAPFMRIATTTYEARARQRLTALHAAGKQRQWVYQVAKPSETRFAVVRRGWFTPSLEKNGTTANNNTTTTDSESLLVSSVSPLPYTVMDLEPVTGRTHQLRVHCAALGQPILGDPTYGWHGEAAPLGGLSWSNSSNNDNKHHSHVVAASCPTTTTTTTTTFPSNTTMTTTRPSMLHAWNLVHPPNVAPMCLHAAFLEVPHPVDRDKMISCQTVAPFDSLFDDE